MSDKLTIRIPESIEDITLSQYIEVQKLINRGLDDVSFMERIIILFSGISKRDIKNIDIRDYSLLGDALNKALSTESKFKNRFKLDGVEYGFIPNFDKMSQGEYIDLTSNNLEGDSLPTIMAVLFRPIIKSDSFDNYKIAPYDADPERIEIMKGIPMNIVNGAMVFFWNLAKELKSYTLKSMEVQEEERSQQ
jgi:hypothetical protein